jgi:acetyl esterase/lipase
LNKPLIGGGLQRRSLLLASGCLPFMSAGCSITEVLNATTPGFGLKQATGIAYGQDIRQRLDVYWPQKPAPAARTVLFFYGGSWNSGARQEYAFVGKALAAQGITTVVADYRLFPQVRYPAFLQDCASAARFCVDRLSNTTGTPLGSFYLMGHSAGAYNAAMLALDPRWLAQVNLSAQQLSGWIGLAGPYDFLPITVPEVKPVFGHPDVPPDSQPLFFANQKAIRTFLGVADPDPLVNPKRNSEALASLLRARGTEVVFRRYPSTNHGSLVGSISLPLRWLDPVLTDIVSFIQ